MGLARKAARCSISWLQKWYGKCIRELKEGVASSTKFSLQFNMHRLFFSFTFLPDSRFIFRGLRTVTKRFKTEKLKVRIWWCRCGWLAMWISFLTLRTGSSKRGSENSSRSVYWILKESDMMRGEHGARVCKNWIRKRTNSEETGKKRTERNQKAMTISAFKC